MKQLITSFFILLIAVYGRAQGDTSYYTDHSNLSKTLAERIHASVSMGGGVSFFNSKSTSNFTYIAPALQYQLSSKFILSAGLIHYNVTGTPFTTRSFSDRSSLNPGKPYSGNSIQVGGLYQLNERLRLSGSLLVQVNPLLNNKQVNYKATSLGLDYKVNSHTTLSIKTNIIQGNGYNSLYYSPFDIPSMPRTGMQQRTFNTYPNGLFPNGF